MELKTVVDTGEPLPDGIWNTHYRHRLWCNNCNELHYVYIAKGVTVPQGITGVICKRCGCLLTVRPYPM